MNTYFYDDYEIAELSYFEYKHLVKSFISADDEKLIKIFERLLSSKIKAERRLHIGDKIKILLLLRCLILGEEININYEGKNYNYNLNTMINSIAFNKKDFCYNDMVFKVPRNLFYSSKFSCLIDNFHSFKLNGEIKIIDEYTYKQKELILQNLLQMKVSNLVKEFSEYLESFSIGYINNITINLFDINLLKLIKNFYTSDLNEMYNLEYNILHFLKFDSNVFDRYGLPELRIFVNKFNKEQEELSKKSGNKNIDL